MDQWKDISQPNGSSSVPTSSVVNPLPTSQREPRQRPEAGKNECVVARKVQKADREKLRRDKLNEQFLELGTTIDPDRPKNDKGTILMDTIQLLKDLSSEVNRLKAECETLSEESRELMHEKNELREEKASLKSDVDNLNVQYQQRLRVMVPWAIIDPSVVMAPTYPFPVPLHVPPGPIPMHPFPFWGNQNPGAIPNPCSTFIQYPGAAHPQMDQPSTNYPSVSRVSSRQDSKSKSVDHHKDGNDEKSDDSGDIVTDLELKTPGSNSHQESPVRDRKGKQSLRKDRRNNTDESCSSKQSSSQCFQDSSSNNMGNTLKSNK